MSGDDVDMSDGPDTESHTNTGNADGHIPASESPSASEKETNGIAGDAKQTSEEGSTETSVGTRSNSSRVASLRAAFEQAEKPADGAKRQLSNSSGQEQSVEIARLKAELEKERELRVAYEEKISTLEEEIEELNSQFEERDDEHERRGQQERLEAQTRMNALGEEARTQRQEANNLQKQLSDLKRSVSVSTRPSTHVSDTTFREQADVLQYEVQNWIVQNLRRVKIEASIDDLCARLEQVTDQKQCERLKPIYNSFESSVKLPIFQATVACFLMSIFDEPYLYGLHGRVEWAERSRQAAEALLSVLQPAAYNRCRAVTFDALRQSESMKAVVEKSSQEIATKINVALLSITEIEENEARLASLRVIMQRAIELAHLMRVQQAKYEVVLPSPRDQFDVSMMDDIFEDADADAERTVRLATFPALVKTTDEEGIRFESRSIVAKAKVLCEVNET